MIEQQLAKPGTMNHVERNIARLLERESEIDDRILKAYMDYAERLLDADEYQMIKEKLIGDKDALTVKRKALEKKHIEMNRMVQQYKQVASRLENALQETEFNEELVKELIEKIWVSDDGSVSIEFKCQDVFSSPLVDEFILENAEGGA